MSRARFAPDTIGDHAVADPDMGVAADALAESHGVTRERQDAFALASHTKALAAAEAGRFDGELVALPRGGGSGAAPPAPSGNGRLVRDESPRSRLTLRALAGLPPAFGAGGTVTAGNASPINDGSAIVAVASSQVREALGVGAALRFVEGTAAGVDPRSPGTGPIAATRRLLERVGIGVADIDLIELTEAFAGQALACIDALEMPGDRVNVRGGAIALGHPWGASGAVLVTRLFTEMVRAPDGQPPPRYGLATLAGAGGVGVATLLERDG
jgi:acetyl-CoA C-acetyltransferase